MATKVKVVLTQPAANFLFRMLLNPGSIIREELKQYQPDKLGGAEVARLQRWLKKNESLVTQREEMVMGPNGPQKQPVYECHAWTGHLEKKYVERIKDMTDHYKDQGRMTVNCEGYFDLLDGLEGKDPVLDVEIVEANRPE